MRHEGAAHQDRNGPHLFIMRLGKHCFNRCLISFLDFYTEQGTI